MRTALLLKRSTGYRQELKSLVGKKGVVEKMVLGNPVVKIKSKSYPLNRSEVIVVE